MKQWFLRPWTSHSEGKQFLRDGNKEDEPKITILRGFHGCRGGTWAKPGRFPELKRVGIQGDQSGWSSLGIELERRELHGEKTLEIDPPVTISHVWLHGESSQSVNKESVQLVVLHLNVRLLCFGFTWCYWWWLSSVMILPMAENRRVWVGW